MNNKGFAVSGIIYSILILFLILIFSILSIMGARKMVLDKLKNDVMNELNDVGVSNKTLKEIAEELVYSNGSCKTDGSTYQYVGGCYIKGGISGKDIFYLKMLGMVESQLDPTQAEQYNQLFFDENGNFKKEDYEKMIFGDMSEEEINQFLEQNGVSSAFEYQFGVTSEEMFGIKRANNYVWYSGFLWRIMGINADGSIRMITEDNITSLSLENEARKLNWDESQVRDWLNNYFYPKLKNNEIIVDQMWCSEESNEKTPMRTTCTNNLSKIPAKVGMITIDEYTLSNHQIGFKAGSYLNVGHTSSTMTPIGDNLSYGFASDTIKSVVISEGIPNDKLYAGVRAIINIKPETLVTSGNGDLVLSNWGTDKGPYILNNEKEENTNGKLSDNATSGEYVNFAEKKYRIVGIENGNTKMILDGYYEENGEIYKTLYGNSNKFTTTEGIGQKLNTDVLEWLVPSSDTTNRNKLVTNYTWFQNNYNYGDNYKISTEGKNNPVTATVGLISMGELFTTQDSGLYTKGYTTTSYVLNVNNNVSMTNSSAGIWIFGIENIASSVTITTMETSIRPVIVIKSDVNIISGNGTWSNPYQI